MTIGRRVMRSAGASTIGKRTNKAAAIAAVAGASPVVCSAGARMLLSFLGVQCGCENTVCRTLLFKRRQCHSVFGFLAAC